MLGHLEVTENLEERVRRGRGDEEGDWTCHGCGQTWTRCLCVVWLELLPGFGLAFTTRCLTLIVGRLIVLTYRCGSQCVHSPVCIHLKWRTWPWTLSSAHHV